MTLTNTLFTMSPGDIRRVAAKLPMDLQVQLASAFVSTERHIEDAKAATLVFLQSSEGQRLQRQMQAEKQRKPVYSMASGGLITRGQQPALAAMQADLARLKKRGAQLTRQVQRERRGW